ncbi:diaminopimelate epimerase [Candidatus Pelagibacter sp.]|nr:diaminopimelate epimerase [Candidatus Pelagibacter sp.]
MEFKAFKMDGLGNDFVIIDNRSNNVELTRDQIIRICDRKFIGCDQLIFVNKSNKGDAEMEFYNSDGSISGACGNGTRCVAFLIFKETDKKVVDLFVGSNQLKSKILENSEVETIIGVPKTHWKDIPISENLDTKNLGIEISDKNNLSSKGGIAVNVGNPHVIFFVDNIDDFDLKKIGPMVENNKLFPEKCNFTLANKIGNNHYKVKVWERGAGLTKACGTAACATAVAANLEKLENSSTEIEFSLGKLIINIDQDKRIHMRGPVSEIKEIKINI